MPAGQHLQGPWWAEQRVWAWHRDGPPRLMVVLSAEPWTLTASPSPGGRVHAHTALLRSKHGVQGCGIETLSDFSQLILTRFGKTNRFDPPRNQ